jgi:uncharacterized protein
MGKRDSHEPGTFCWVDLSTSDADGAKAFYGELLGWEFEDSDMPGGGVYTMCHVQGDAVAAIIQQEEQPGHWNNYVTVVSADETAAKVKQLGANVLEEPFDVMEAGRMAVFADPSGAVLCVWQPQAHIGARRVNDPGCMTWNELQTREPERMAAYYAELFGWKMEAQREDANLAYVVIKNGGKSNGGIMPVTEQQGDAPSFWLAYFTVASSDDAAARTQELGGRVYAGPMNIGAGRIAVLSDPQGAAFAIFEGQTDD